VSPRSTIRRLRAQRRLLVAIGLSLISAVCLSAAALYALTKADPAGWSTLNSADPAVAQAAFALENAVINQAHAARPGNRAEPSRPWLSEPWTVSLSQHDANSWLAASLPRWLANQQPPVRMPDELTGLQLRFTTGGISVAARVQNGSQSHIIAASFEPELRADGSLWMPASWISIGRLPVPASWILGRIADQSRQANSSIPESLLRLADSSTIIDSLQGRIPIVQTPEVRLADGRRVRLLKIEPREGEVWLTMQTVGR
jgi:hypothetical protein